jgi:hypothetical protein
LEVDPDGCEMTAMPRLRDERTLLSARESASGLLQALKEGHASDAKRYAERLSQVGIEALTSLSPRGTLKYAATSRLDDGKLINGLLHLLKSDKVPRNLWPACFDVLGVWAGGEAVPIVGRLLHGRSGEPNGDDWSRILQHGFNALHMIGGPDAVRILTDFQKADLPSPIRVQASWYLNQLGARVVDFMFGSEETEPASPEEVAVRDSLADPYHWTAACAALATFFLNLYREAWPRLKTAVEAVIPASVVEPPLLDWKRTCHLGGESVDDKIDVWESVTLAALIRFSDARLLVLDGALAFFPERDVRSKQACQSPLGWWAVLLDPSSLSARYLDRLALLRAPATSKAWEDSLSGNLRSPDLHELIRSWVNQLPALAQQFNRRDARWLSFALAVLHDSMHKQMDWPRPRLAETLHAWLTPYPKGAAARE